jgi:hypothetical protein
MQSPRDVLEPTRRALEAFVLEHRLLSSASDEELAVSQGRAKR